MSDRRHLVSSLSDEVFFVLPFWLSFARSDLLLTVVPVAMAPEWATVAWR